MGAGEDTAALRRTGRLLGYVDGLRDQGLALFDALASACKTLRANPGKHGEIPRFETDSSLRFFTRHLGQGR